MNFMPPKKILLLFLSVLFVLSVVPGKSFVFAKIDCVKYKNTCPDENLISEIKKSCGTSILDSVYSACEKEKKTAQQRMSELSSKKVEIEKEEGSVEWYLSNINYDIKGINAEIINAESSLDEIEKEIEKTDKVLLSQRELLSEALRQVYEYDNSSYIEILLGNGSLAEFSEKLAEVEKIQRQISSSIKEIAEIRKSLEKKRNEQLRYKNVQKLSRQSLAVRRDQQGYLLSQLKSAKTPIEQEMTRLNMQLREVRTAMTTISNYLFATLGYRVNAKDIFNAVKIASSQNELRPSFLLAILQKEAAINKKLSNTGSRSGNIQQCVDMCKVCSNCVYCSNTKSRRQWCTNQQNSLERICGKLGLNPNDTSKVRITMDYGMGPSQFIPTTWEGYGFTGNPWNLNYAVLAMATKLGKGSGDEESKACKYNGYDGKPCSYGTIVMRYTYGWQEVISTCGFSLSCSDLRARLEEKF